MNDGSFIIGFRYRSARSFSHLPLKAPVRIPFKFERTVVIFETVFRRFPMRLKKDDKRLRILDSAIKVFAHEGFFRAKVSQIAVEAGVAPGTVYLYFKNKEDLLISIFEEKMQDINSEYRAAIVEKRDGRSRLECLVRMHLAGFQRQPDLAACFQVELRQSSRFMRENVKGELQRYLDLIREIVEYGRRDGSFRNELPVRLVTHLIFGTLDEVVSTWVLSGMEYNLVTLTDPLMDLFTNGLGRGVDSVELDGTVGGRTAQTIMSGLPTGRR
ncbi:Transcriptional regulator, TetR family (modular protein) [Syntrophobacter sp. SbD2]|nr:Transcriptional regulator, TetR family (modular protein) [Syntrophobacter sp. SbD2]